jgi:hypothetical protein
VNESKVIVGGFGDTAQSTGRAQTCRYEPVSAGFTENSNSLDDRCPAAIGHLSVRQVSRRKDKNIAPMKEINRMATAFSPTSHRTHRFAPLLIISLSAICWDASCGAVAGPMGVREP